MRRVYFRNILALTLVTAIGASLVVLFNSRGAQKPKEQTAFSAWLADWDYKSGLSDFEELKSSLSQVQIFAACFNSNDNLLFTENFEHLKESMGKHKSGDSPAFFLTIVNDRINEDGTTLQKDPGILSRILDTAQSRDRHIDELIQKTLEGRFDGIEIDYEKIPKQSFSKYADFISELYTRASEHKLALRVVIESGVNTDKLALPEGPQYAVMLYNLYGTHSGPGPKADYKFIKGTLNKFTKLPGENNIAALSLGGFDWPDTGKAAALTEEQAAKLAVDKGVKAFRDKDSGALSFNYMDEKNVRHTVWYADMETIDSWAAECKKHGYGNIALWRLGGCSQELKDYLNGER